MRDNKLEELLDKIRKDIDHIDCDLDYWWDVIAESIDKNISDNYISKEEVEKFINRFEKANETINNKLLQTIINLLNQLIK